MVRPSLTVPLAALRTFEAVVRLRGLAPAANELGLTVSAVSHQLAGLEPRLGRALLERQGRRVVPTAAGAALAKALGGPFAEIDSAVRNVRDARAVLTVSVHDTFAAHWLLPRLRGFTEDHPELDLRLATTARLVDLDRERIDCAIRLGPGGWPGVTAHFMAHQTVAPVIRADKRGEAPFRRIVHEAEAAEWDRWTDLPTQAADLTVLSRDLVIDAVLAGSGAGIVDCVVLADAIATGELVVLAPARETDWSYFVLTPAERRSTPAVSRFIEWLKAEAGADGA